MLSKKKIIIIALAIIVIIGAAIALLLADETFFAPAPADDQAATNQEPAEANLPSTARGLEPAEPVAAIPPIEQHLVTVARNFAERYGSFSTDSRFTNLEEVKLLSTAKLQKELDETIKTAEAAQEFYGVSSKALKIDVINLDEGAGTAEVKVSLQREESRAGRDDFVYYQDLSLSLVRSGPPRAESRGGTWLVDEARWE